MKIKPVSVIFAVIMFVLTAAAVKWNEYPFWTVPSDNDTFLVGTSVTNRQITWGNLKQWTFTNAQGLLGTAARSNANAFQAPLGFAPMISNSASVLGALGINAVPFANSITGAPGNNKYYGTDGTGNKGFYIFPTNAVPTNGVSIANLSPLFLNIITNLNGYSFTVYCQTCGLGSAAFSGIGAFMPASQISSNWASVNTNQFSRTNLATASVDGPLSHLDWSLFNAKEPAIPAGTTAQYWRGDKTFATLNATAVGLGNVANAPQVVLVSGVSPIHVTGTTSATVSIDNAAADGSTKGAASFNASDFNSASGNISLDYVNGQSSDDSTKGYLTAADHLAFNQKPTSQQVTNAIGSGITNLTVALSDNLVAPSAISVGSSPFSYTNKSSYYESVTIGGGTVSGIALTGVASGMTQACITLQTNEYVTVTYSGLPTMLHKAIFK